MLLWGVFFIACAGIVRGLPRYHHSQTSNLQDGVSPEVSHVNGMEPTALIIHTDVFCIMLKYRENVFESLNSVCLSQIHRSSYFVCGGGGKNGGGGVGGYLDIV